MLVRINSGAGGIVEYLERGRKRGREFDRDLIDERLPLAGDIDLLEAVIDQIEARQEGDARYLHITLGFAEQFTTALNCGPGQINAQRLHEIVEAYREIVMAAYDVGEYHFYAEAHIPKVTHELNATTGDYESRLPHVHIVIPTRNIESGRFMNPFGYLRDMSVPDAIQEHINRRFDLKSPKDFRRDPAAPAHPLSRHRATLDGQSPKQIRAYLESLVADGHVGTFNELVEAASIIGVVTIRRGKEGDYINVKPDWAARGINIKDLVRQSFSERAAQLRPTGIATDHDEVVDLWCKRGAFEARYISFASVRLRKAFTAMSEAQRVEFLADRRRETRERMASYEGPDYLAQLGAEVEAINEREKNSAQSSIRRRIAEAQPKGPKLTSLERLELAGQAIERGRRALEADPQRILSALRRRELALALKAALKKLSLVGPRESKSVIEALADSPRSSGIPADRLKSDTNPTLVLAAAQRLYGLSPGDYSIGIGADGNPRIAHANRQYNLGDFFTKHLQRPWAEAESVLRDCYHASLSEALPPPDPSLWRQFSQWRARQIEETAQLRTKNSEGFRKRVLQAREEYREQKAKAMTLPARERARVVALARADQFVAQQGIVAERAKASKEARVPNRNAHYRQYLTGLAAGGDVSALAELRRLAPAEAEPPQTVWGRGGAPVFPLPTYSVDAKGNVLYYVEGHAIVRDGAQGVTVIKAERTAYDAAIRVAIARYGRTLTLNGDARFVAGMLDSARRTGLQLALRDASKPEAMPTVFRGRGRQEPELER